MRRAFIDAYNRRPFVYLPWRTRHWDVKQMVRAKATVPSSLWLYDDIKYLYTYKIYSLSLSFAIRVRDEITLADWSWNAKLNAEKTTPRNKYTHWLWNRYIPHKKSLTRDAMHSFRKSDMKQSYFCVSWLFVCVWAVFCPHFPYTFCTHMEWNENELAGLNRAYQPFAQSFWTFRKGRWIFKCNV